MFITTEEAKIWESIDEDVREEVTSTIKMCRDSSEMNDDNHPKNQQFSDAFAVVVGILES